jgi:hypothetical protein
MYRAGTQNTKADTLTRRDDKVESQDHAKTEYCDSSEKGVSQRGDTCKKDCIDENTKLKREEKKISLEQ